VVAAGSTIPLRRRTVIAASGHLVFRLPGNLGRVRVP